jgi:hypothetical protein
VRTQTEMYLTSKRKGLRLQTIASAVNRSAVTISLSICVTW